MATGSTRRTKIICDRVPGANRCARSETRCHTTDAASEAARFTSSRKAKINVIASKKYMKLLRDTYLASFFLNKPVQLVKQFSISLAHCIDDAGEHRFDTSGSSFKDAAYHVFSDTALEFFVRVSRRIHKCAPFTAAVKHSFFVKPVERGHYRRISQASLKRRKHVADADLFLLPNVLHGFTLQLSE